MAARDALQSFAPAYPSFDIKSSKVRLLLMSAEPDAPRLFQSEPICAEHFTVETFPHEGTDKSYVQSDFRAMPLEKRIEDTHRFLAEIDILANWVDAAVVSANSNAGRLIMTRGGPTRVINEHRVRSVDIPWHVRGSNRGKRRDPALRLAPLYSPSSFRHSPVIATGHDHVIRLLDSFASCLLLVPNMRSWLERRKRA